MTTARVLRFASPRKPAKPAPRKVPVKPVKHRTEPKYKDASRDRAAALVQTFIDEGIIASRQRSRVTLAVLWALDDARSAGFGAGIAWARSK
jgi:hypothetical protein